MLVFRGRAFKITLLIFVATFFVLFFLVQNRESFSDVTYRAAYLTSMLFILPMHYHFAYHDFASYMDESDFWKMYAFFSILIFSILVVTSLVHFLSMGEEPLLVMRRAAIHFLKWYFILTFPMFISISLWRKLKGSNWF